MNASWPNPHAAAAEIGADVKRLIPPTQIQSRRGIASTLAMLYLVLFSTLAVGFYATFTLASSSAYGDREARRSLAAAESGMEFVRYQLWALDVPHNTPADQLFDLVHDQLAARLDGSANLNGGSIARVGEEIHIPASGYISLDGDDTTGFRAVLRRDGKEILCETTGRVGDAVSSARAIRLRYGIFERPSSIFSYGVASKSAITMTGNTAILGSPNPASGSVLSTASISYPLSMGSNCEISGEVSFSNPDAWVMAGKNSVINNEHGESNWSDNIHHVDEPDFPVVDTSDYLPYATNVVDDSSPDGSEYVNIRIPPNTNPTFNAGTKLKGVIYIEAPNKIKFAGHAEITGVIVAENGASGHWSDNQIEFRGTVNATGPQDLPYGDARFEGLHQMGGAFILAENFAVDFGGNADAGATGVAGSIIASAITFSGTADATVEGSIINLADSGVEFSGNSSVTIRSSGTKDKPHGLYFGSRYVPLPGSYEEVME